mmetsp:Transcript_6790/g.19596  ORF Transcript_6790/g.19596 Transcript_6790/m.19596 type:complete len:83 (-) Transcript_6790:2677-2925(-)
MPDLSNADVSSAEKAEQWRRYWAAKANARQQVGFCLDMRYVNAVSQPLQCDADGVSSLKQAQTAQSPTCASLACTIWQCESC